MDLSTLMFDDATLEFCSSFEDQDKTVVGATEEDYTNFGTDLDTDISNMSTALNDGPLSSPEPMHSMSPTNSSMSGGDDSGMDSTLHYFTDGSHLSYATGASDAYLSSGDESQHATVAPLTLLTAPSDFKYILDHAVTTPTNIKLVPTSDVTATTNTSPILAQAAADIFKDTVEPQLLDIAASLTAKDLAAAEIAADASVSSPDTDAPPKVPYSAKSADGKIELKIMSQPARNHRARYRTEGSRGAVKDRSGRSFPIVKLSGYNRQSIKLRCYIGDDKRPGEPHLFYQVSRIQGKNVTNCTQTKIEGIKVIEIELNPATNMQAVINCVGIVKERNFDVQRKASNLRKKHLYGEDDGGKKDKKEKSQSKSQSSSGASSSGSSVERRSTACTLVFGLQIPDTNEILQVVSDPINCAQLLGCPEVHKISATRSDIKGGDEVFIIGKNFTRDTKLLFECPAGNWTDKAIPESEYINQNHLVFRVPAYTGPLDKDTQDATGTVDTTFKVKCGEKYSEPYLFSYSTQPQVGLSTWILK